MNDDITDLNAERNRRAEPDPQFIRQDDYGRKMYVFLTSYNMDGKEWCSQILAYDEADAANRVEAMRQSLKVDGKLFGEVPL